MNFYKLLLLLSLMTICSSKTLKLDSNTIDELAMKSEKRTNKSVDLVEVEESLLNEVCKLVGTKFDCSNSQVRDLKKQIDLNSSIDSIDFSSNLLTEFKGKFIFFFKL